MLSARTKNSSLAVLSAVFQTLLNFLLYNVCEGQNKQQFEEIEFVCTQSAVQKQVLHHRNVRKHKKKLAGDCECGVGNSRLP
jgi:hypothetical protein